MQPLTVENIVKFFVLRGGVVRTALIADTKGLDTMNVQALIGQMMENGVLAVDGDSLRLTANKTSPGKPGACCDVPVELRGKLTRTNTGTNVLNP